MSYILIGIGIVLLILLFNAIIDVRLKKQKTKNSNDDHKPSGK